MIAFLKGILKHKSRSEIILDVNGVGYLVFISKKVSESLGELNTEFSLLTYLDVKENSLQLYGFSDEKEREMFKMLLSVSGIGTKLAHTILSNMTFGELIGIISGRSNFTKIKIPGLGAKKLELITMSLKDKIYKIGSDSGYGGDNILEQQGSDFVRFEALNALMNLGYQRSDAERIIREVLKQNDAGNTMTTEEIIRKSLEIISA